MKIRIASDIHNEFLTDSGAYKHYVFPPMDDDKETTLILAGDICLLNSPRTFDLFLREVSNQFKYVFWIAGNHEYYHGNIDQNSVKSVIDYLKLDNVFTGKLILEREKIAIIGDTLWTDFEDGDPASMFIAKRGMSDFSVIGVGDRKGAKLHPARCFMIHRDHKDRIFKDVDYYSDLGFKIIVVTHHQPSRQGIGEEFKGDPLNGAFVSNLDKEIKEHNIDYWIAGHTHNRNEYMIGNTKVITNPLGYPFETETMFEPTLTIDI